MRHWRNGAVTALAVSLISGCLSGGSGVVSTTSRNSASVNEPANVSPNPTPVATVTPLPSALPGAGGNRSITVSWAPNLEAGVNRTGGGYRIFYSTSPTFPAASTGTLMVPYVTGQRAPTSATITGLSPGQYHIRVAAFSSIISPVTGQASASDNSTTVTIQVP